MDEICLVSNSGRDMRMPVKLLQHLDRNRIAGHASERVARNVHCEFLINFCSKCDMQPQDFVNRTGFKGNRSLRDKFII